jgi:UPF0716 protein FxsA
MGLLILAIILAIPLIEIAVFIEVGSAIGVAWTIAIIVLGTIIGVSLVRIQGFVTLTRARQQLDQGVLPGRELFDAVCLALAGILIFLPGFVTDILGVLLLLPPVRGLARRLAAAWLEKHGREVRVQRQGTVIEGEYEDLGSDENRPSRNDRGAGPERLLR